MEEILTDFRKQMDEVLALAEDDLKSIKTGRAKPSLIEDVKVNVKSYGSVLTLKELAAITTPDPHMLIVSPWDKQILKDLEKALSQSELQIHPVIDNDIIRVKIPPLTEETRKDLVKLVNQKLESVKKIVRQERNEHKSQIEEKKGEAGVSEDDVHQTLEELQKIVDEYMEKLEGLAKSKEKELLTI